MSLAGSRGSHVAWDSVKLDWVNHRKIQHINETGKWAESLSRPSVHLMSRRMLRVVQFSESLCMSRLVCGADYTEQFTLGSFQ